MNAGEWVGCLLVFLACLSATASEVDPLSDLQDRFIAIEQGWGELGLDTCAHASGIEPLPLQIGEKKYARGIGTHANGVIEIALDGKYDQFDAEVGLQPLATGNGSVVFQVFVDDAKQFDSGVMREDTPPKPVSLSLKGAHRFCGLSSATPVMASPATVQTGPTRA